MNDEKKFIRVYVWQLAVRIFHWANVTALIVLAITGFIIANPPALLIKAEASDVYWMGTLRFIHFTAAYLFFVVMILRIYWAFAGNRFAHWTNFIPLGKEKIENFIHVLKIDILLQNEKIYDPKHVSIGHNSVAAFSYLIMFILALIQVFTGFGIYSANSDWWLPNLFSWVVPMLGGDFAARQIHHIVMWMFIFFSIVHVYLVFYHDWLEGTGESSSMISGYKFVGSKRVSKSKESSNKETKEE